MGRMGCRNTALRLACETPHLGNVPNGGFLIYGDNMISCLSAVFCCPCRTYQRCNQKTNVVRVKHRSQSPTPPTPPLEETRIEVVASTAMTETATYSPAVSQSPPKDHKRAYTWDKSESKFRVVGWLADG